MSPRPASRAVCRTIATGNQSTPSTSAPLNTAKSTSTGIAKRNSIPLDRMIRPIQMTRGIAVERTSLASRWKACVKSLIQCVEPDPRQQRCDQEHDVRILSRRCGGRSREHEPVDQAHHQRVAGWTTDIPGSSSNTGLSDRERTVTTTNADPAGLIRARRQWRDSHSEPRECCSTSTAPSRWPCACRGTGRCRGGRRSGRPALHPSAARGTRADRPVSRTCSRGNTAHRSSRRNARTRA